jgi:hypothetical protein
VPDPEQITLCERPLDKTGARHATRRATLYRSLGFAWTRRSVMYYAR